MDENEVREQQFSVDDDEQKRALEDREEKRKLRLGGLILAASALIVIAGIAVIVCLFLAARWLVKGGLGV